MKIPVRNFYYLLCYAWDTLAESRVVPVGASDYDHLVNLFARVLSGGLEHLLKRGPGPGLPRAPRRVRRRTRED